MNLTLKFAAKELETPRAASRLTREERDRDIVPGNAGRRERGPHRAREEPIAWTPTAREGICACARWSSTASPTAAPAAPLPANCTCGVSGWDTVTIEPWRAASPSPSSKTGGPTAAPSTASSRRAASFREHRRHAGRQTRYRFQDRADLAMTRRPASAAAPAYAVCRTRPPCSLSPAKSLTSTYCRRAKPEKDRRVLNMVKQMDKKALATARSPAPAKRFVPRKYNLSFNREDESRLRRGHSQRQVTGRSAGGLECWSVDPSPEALLHHSKAHGSSISVNPSRIRCALS